MSGLALVWRRDGAPTDPQGLAAIQAALAHRAVDGEDSWRGPDGSLALGHAHFWTTPEEVDERQPLVTDDCALVFDGRLDARDELTDALGMDRTRGRVVSDAGLVLAAYLRWGEAAVSRLFGPFALVIADWRRGRVLLARDAIGRRSLAYALDARQLVVASEPQAVASHPDVPEADDTHWWAHYFAASPWAIDRTRFAAVRELEPATALVVGATGQRSWSYWQPHPEVRLDRASDEAHAEAFVATMQRATDRRLRAVARPAAMMSGGLDSGTVATLAAGSSRVDAPLRTYSFVFDQLTSCDERSYIAALVERLGLDSRQLAMDGAWPMADADRWAFDADRPVTSCYRDLLDRLLRSVHADGVRVLLAGYGADELYSGAEDWLADLLAERRYGAAVRQVAGHVRHTGARRLLRSRSVRRVMARSAARLGLRRHRRLAAPPGWLTPWAIEQLGPPRAWPPSAANAQRRSQHESVLDSLSIAGATCEAFYNHWHRVELRYPYTDREVVELMLSLPAHQLYGGGQSKAVLRRAMTDRLPEVVRRRAAPTQLTPLYELAMRQREHERARAVLAEADPFQRRFVRADWLRAADPGRMPDVVQESALWNSVSYGLWRQRRDEAPVRAPVCPMGD